MTIQHTSDETSPLLNEISDQVIPSDASDSTSTGSRLAFRIGAAMYSFFILGLFGSTIGVMLPPLSKYYGLTDLHVSLIFLVGPIGYVIAAQSSGFIHFRFGQRGIAWIGPIFHILSAAGIAVHPPFWVVLVAFAFVGLGTGFLDGSWCAWAGSMPNANTTSGLLHGSFSAGAAAGPFLASLLMEKGNRPWFDYYYLLVAASILELFILTYLFRSETASRYRQEKHSQLLFLDHKVDSTAIFKYRGMWFCAAFFLAYVGTETAVSGWIVSFMERGRHATPYQASLASSGYWAGQAVGRLSLGTVTDRVGVRKATSFYFLCAITVETLFALLQHRTLSIVLMTLLGFLLGPMFPSGVVVLTQLLPKDLHVAAVSFVASLGQVGGALLPFGIGAVVDRLGIAVFRFAILLELGISFFLWVLLSQSKSTKVRAEHEIRGENGE
ncbi:major facilitator superfamily domain-containing protein [Lophiotrema nucula]|uniref:Major facilitator superfamily domain-containing protein n=1 Tax=Lophiotrema nucula TaxID=690887 RepID=A0A6A5ZJF2_9PLEO|nr:major facilitator superfamily domain-containing protein [Lophiotrema nucula]